MKKLVFGLGLLFISAVTSGQTYLIFLHNRFLEEYGLQDIHPEYGRCEYREIIQRFRQAGFSVISEIRAKNTDAVAYAHKVAGQVDSLIGTGVKPGKITVVGTSKGGYIAQYVSSFVQNKEVNYVFVGCCDDSLSNMPNIAYYGNILSIYERSDAWHSCQQMRDRHPKNVSRFKEVEVNTGLKHGFLYKASDSWMKPSIAWARDEY